MTFIDPDNMAFIDPDNIDEKSIDATEALKKTYAHTVEPGIQYLQGLAPMAVQGLGNIVGTVVSGGDTKFATELGEEWSGKVPQIPSTDIGKEKMEALQHYIGKMKEGGGDIGARLSPMFGFNEPLTRGVGELIGELGPLAAVFGAARRGAGGRPQVTPEEMEAGRRARQPAPPPPNQPEYQPKAMPLKPGEQGELFAESRGPEGSQGELFPKQARSADELRIDDTSRQPLQETIEPPAPPSRD